MAIAVKPTEVSVTAAPTPDPAQLAIRIVNGMMSRFDTDQDGTLSKAEFVRGMTVFGIPPEKAMERYMALDVRGRGSVTREQLRTAARNGTLPLPQQAAPPPPPPPPAAAAVTATAVDPADAVTAGTQVDRYV